MYLKAELTPEGLAKFDHFFAAYARDGINKRNTRRKLLGMVARHASANADTFAYELGPHATRTGQTERLQLEACHVSVVKKNWTEKEAVIHGLCSLIRECDELDEQYAEDRHRYPDFPAIPFLAGSNRSLQQ